MSVWLTQVAHAALAAAPWSGFVSVVDARDAEHVVVLDARAGGDFKSGHIPGAQHVDWLDHRDGLFRTGRLSDDVDGVAARFAALGVDADRPVLVCGAAKDGWGEEGRTAWTLRYLGHAQVAILDGGCDAWRAAGLPWTRDTARPRRGTFAAGRRTALRATRADVQRALAQDSAQIVDARSRAEYDGATPHYEPRGGHVPGALHLDEASLFDQDGRVLRGDRLDAALLRAGVDRRRLIIAYCTAGVRSAMLVEILRAAGIDARNYDGSMWEWAADPTLPLTTSTSAEARDRSRP